MTADPSHRLFLSPRYAKDALVMSDPCEMDAVAPSRESVAPARNLLELSDPQPITNNTILIVLHYVLVEIRGADKPEKARMLADAFHNAPNLIAIGREPQETWESILSIARRLQMEPWVLRLLRHVQSRQIST